MEMPRPKSEHAKLAALAGDWAGDETLLPSKWGPGGKARGRISARQAINDFYVLWNYEEEKDGRVVFKGHGVFAWDDERKDYAFYWFDSMGFLPDSASRGRWVDDGFVFLRVTPRGHVRHTFRFEGEDVFHLTIENSFDEGQTFQAFMSGSYTRVPFD